MNQAKLITSSYPPGPKRKIPFAGLLAYRRGPLPFFQNLAKQYGDISYFKLGPQEAYFLNHPDYIKDVLVTNNQNFMKGLVLQRAKRLLGEGLLPVRAIIIAGKGDWPNLHSIVNESLLMPM